MRIIDANQKMLAIDWARQIEKVVRETDTDIADDISREIDNLDSHKLTVAVVGLMKRGKSTFCNAFLGRHDDLVAPVGRFPTTGVISEFSTGDEEYANVVFTNNSSMKIRYAEIGDYVAEDKNPENRKNVFRLEIFGKFNLDREIKIVDMPGDESIHAYHSEIVYNYLPNADIIIFLSSADDPISRDELSLLRKVQPNEMKKVFFVINKADKCEEDEIAEAKDHDRATLNNAGIRIENDIYVISAKKAMAGEFEYGEFRDLMNDITEFMNGDRYKMVLNGFRGRIMALAEPAVSKLRQRVQFSDMEIEDLEKQIGELEQKKAIMTEQLERGLKEFSDSWDDMLNDFERSLPAIKNNVGMVVREIEAKNALAINKKTIEKLPEKLSAALEKEFEGSSGILEKRAVEALKKLDKSCPEISKFMSEHMFSADIAMTPDGMGGWIFALLSGSATYLTGSVISSAFAVGSTWGGAGLIGGIVAGVGKVVGITAGSVVTAILSPLFILSAAGTTIGFSCLAVSFFRKKNYQKEKLVADLKKAIDSIFRSIKMEKIPYLHNQKELLIRDIRRQFSEKLETLEKDLRDAVEKRKSYQDSRVIETQQRNLLSEYSALIDHAVEDANC